MKGINAKKEMTWVLPLKLNRTQFNIFLAEENNTSTSNKPEEDDK